MNEEVDHVYVLPEDDANHRIANGFLLDPLLDQRRIQVLPNAGGWTHVRDEFEKTHRAKMEKNHCRHMVLLVDFDEKDDRLTELKKDIPVELMNRVLVLGAWSEPEALRQAGLGTYDDIGEKLAQDCRENTNSAWAHPLLQHNAEELRRMTPILKPILFPSP